MVICQYKKQTSKIILFLDADVGIDLGINRRVRSMKNMYLNTDEVQKININLMSSLLKTLLILISIIKVVFNSTNVTDEATQSNFLDIQQTHLNLNLTINFDKKT